MCSLCITSITNINARLSAGGRGRKKDKNKCVRSVCTCVCVAVVCKCIHFSCVFADAACGTRDTEKENASKLGGEGIRILWLGYTLAGRLNVFLTPRYSASTSFPLIRPKSLLRFLFESFFREPSQCETQRFLLFQDRFYTSLTTQPRSSVIYSFLFSVVFFLSPHSFGACLSSFVQEYHTRLFFFFPTRTRNDNFFTVMIPYTYYNNIN
ncbi:hypothetical protein PUN28_010283 [Cardiocondyla obscurior]|uniref:Uncharacterized protein n=1 Tax=Cardiocondyla obscurior TaxID=286306 RepID=A0AAW2FMY6_9HYME